MDKAKSEREIQLERTCNELAGFVTALLQHFEDGTTPGGKTRTLIRNRIEEAQISLYVQPSLRIRLLKKQEVSPSEENNEQTP